MHTWKQGTAKVSTENSLCNREVQIPHLPRAQLTPRTEATLLIWAKNPWILIYFWSLKGGGREKINSFSLELGLFGEHRELQVPVLCQQQSNEGTSRLTLGSPSSPSTLWVLILCSHLDLLLCGISSHFRVLLKAIPRADQGILGYTGDPYRPLCDLLQLGVSHQEQELMFWIPQVHSLFPLWGNLPVLHPKSGSQELKALLHCKMNQNSTDMQSVALTS